jgi:hypothetical protein
MLVVGYRQIWGAFVCCRGSAELLDLFERYRGRHVATAHLCADATQRFGRGESLLGGSASKRREGRGRPIDEAAHKAAAGVVSSTHVGVGRRRGLGRTLAAGRSADDATGRYTDIQLRP